MCVYVCVCALFLPEIAFGGFHSEREDERRQSVWTDGENKKYRGAYVMERLARIILHGPTTDVYHISSTPSYPSSFVFHPYVSFFYCRYGAALDESAMADDVFLNIPALQKHCPHGRMQDFVTGTRLGVGPL